MQRRTGTGITGRYTVAVQIIFEEVKNLNESKRRIFENITLQYTYNQIQNSLIFTKVCNLTKFHTFPHFRHVCEFALSRVVMEALSGSCYRCFVVINNHSGCLLILSPRCARSTHAHWKQKYSLILKIYPPTGPHNSSDLNLRNPSL